MKTKPNSLFKNIYLLLTLIVIAIILFNPSVIIFMTKIAKTLLPLLLAFGISFFMRPFITKIHALITKQKNQNYNKRFYIESVGLSYLIMVVLIFIFFKWLLKPIVYDLEIIWENLSSPNFITILSGKIDSWFAIKSYAFINQIASNLKTEFAANIENFIISSISITSTLIAKALFVLVVAMYISFEYNGIKKIFSNFLAKKIKHKTNKINKVLEEIKVGMNAWGKGWIKDQTFIFLCTLIALWILGLDSFLVLSIIMTLCNFVPFIGPLIGSAIIWIYVLATQLNGSNSLLFHIIPVRSEFIIITTLIVLLVIQSIESFWWIPKVYSEKVSISPLIVLISLYIISTLISPLFSPLTIPIIVILRIIYKNYFVKNNQ